MKRKNQRDDSRHDASNSVNAESGRGQVKHNALAALVTSRIFRSQIVKAKKGKGTYQRREKHSNKGRESYLIAA